MSVKPEAPLWGFTTPAVGERGMDAWFEPCGIYVIVSGNADRPVKIGVSSDVARRILQFEAGNPHGLRCASYHPVAQGVARQVERRVHAMFKSQALGREWFEIDAETAAGPIPELCRLAQSAVETMRQQIQADAAASLSVAEAQQREVRWRAARDRAHIAARFHILDVRPKRSA